MPVICVDMETMNNEHKWTVRKEADRKSVVKGNIETQSFKSNYSRAKSFGLPGMRQREEDAKSRVAEIKSQIDMKEL
jgi:allantoicase